MVFENGAYELCVNLVSIFKVSHNTYASGIKKNVTISKNHKSLNSIRIESKCEKNKVNLAYIKIENDVCRDTTNAINEKRYNVAASQLRIKRKLPCNIELSREDCKRRRIVCSGFKNLKHCTSDCYSGCDSNITLNPNVLYGDINDDSSSTRNLKEKLYKKSSNCSLASKFSFIDSGQIFDQKKIRKTRKKSLDTKLISAKFQGNSKKIGNNSSTKLNKNDDKYIFFYDRINKTTRLIKQTNIRTSKRKRGRSVYNLVVALSKLSVKTKEEIKIE
ncbi:hypothetical protein COBT_001837, partial [Conglomerata obtusa]